MKIGDRIKEIMIAKRLTQRELGELMNYTDVAIGKIIKNSSEPKFGVMNTILVNFPDVSAKWLMTGEGKMLGELTFNNNVEIVRYISENRKEFLNMKSFNSLLPVIKGGSDIEELKMRMDKMQEMIESIKKD